MGTKLFPDEEFFILRNADTKTPTGFKRRKFPDNSIYILPDSSIARFIEEYQALINYNTGLMVEVFDGLSDQVDRFVLLYAFREGIPDVNYFPYKEYIVFEEKLDNLEALELLDLHKKMNGKVDS